MSSLFNRSECGSKLYTYRNLYIDTLFLQVRNEILRDCDDMHDDGKPWYNSLESCGIIVATPEVEK